MKTTTAELAERWFGMVWNARQRHQIDEWMDERVQGFSGGQTIVGRETWKIGVYDVFVAAFPDLRFECLTVMGNDNEAMVRWVFTGTHTGTGLGEATGQRIELPGFTWQRFANQRIVEGRDGFDATGLRMALASGESQVDVSIVAASSSLAAT